MTRFRWLLAGAAALAVAVVLAAAFGTAGQPSAARGFRIEADSG